MTKSKTKIMTLFTAVILLCLCVGILAACNGKKGGSVTFIADGKEQVVDISDDGSVTAPKVSKEYYNFMGWYTDENYETKYDEKAAKDGDKAYAYFVSIKMEVYVNGHDEGEKELKDLSTLTVTYEKAATDKNLTFDGWYVDAGFTTKYTTQDADNLYGREMAQVTFDNGYETVYTELVQINTAMAKPKAETVAKNYMDTEDISYADANGNAFDFNTPFSQNTTLTVLWKTPGIHYYLLDGTQKDYVALGIEDKALNYPVISFLSKNVTIKDESGNIIENANVIAVDNGAKAINTANSPALFYKAKKWIFNEGIKYIGDIGFHTQTSVEEIVFPSTLKIIEGSFWNCSNLTSFNLPDGLEVLIDSFWVDRDPISNNMSSATTFEIGVPDSVINIDHMPENLKFGENSDFYYEDGQLYQKDGDIGKILVSAYQSNIENDTMVVPEGVTAIEVGVLYQLKFTYLSLPSTLADVAYNIDSKSDKYKDYYTGRWLTDLDHVKSARGVNTYSYSIVDSLGNIEYVYFKTSEYPAGFDNNPYLFTDERTPYTLLDEEKLVYVGTVTEGKLKITVRARNAMMGVVDKIIIDEFDTGVNLTKELLLEKAGITSEALGAQIQVTSVKSFGQDYISGVKDCNQYIDIEYSYTATGFTYEENADGRTVTVTGLDVTTAQNLGTEENPGPYLVIIPSVIDGKTVTAIKNGAFKGNSLLARIFIANTVETIGDEAFMNTANLEYVEVMSGGLKVIGRSAFENAGCTYNSESKEWEITSTLPTNVYMSANSPEVQGIYISFPLADLTDVKPYAFKSKAIPAFQPAKGEEERLLLGFDWSTGVIVFEDLKPGTFLYQKTADNVIASIIKYVKIEVVSKPNMMNTEENVDVNVYDVQYVATACGYSYDRANTMQLSCGYTMRRMAAYGTMMPAYGTYNTHVIRYEMMEGSVSFMKNIGVRLTLVSKIHKNAFTDMDQNVVGWYTYANDVWLTEDDVHNQNPEIFEEAWWEGKPNSENDFMENLTSTYYGY